MRGAHLRTVLLGAVIATAGATTACRAPAHANEPGAAALATSIRESGHARQILCGDIGEDTCLVACPNERTPREHAECLLRLRFASDPEALALARALFAKTGTLVGLDMRPSIEGYRGSDVSLTPALPIGDQRHHLEWVHASLSAFDDFVSALAPRASKPIAFRPRPKAFIFFETAESSYPSAYCVEQVIGYNLRGPLHEDQKTVRETLFHELFHLNDNEHGVWSTSVLAPVFDNILQRCGTSHECLVPFAPHDTVVAEGTFYAFDPRTRDVREYAAELALRYFLENERILAGEVAPFVPFKCLTEENRWAWDRLVDEFFGGADLTPTCDAR